MEVEQWKNMIAKNVNIIQVEYLTEIKSVNIVQ